METESAFLRWPDVSDFISKTRSCTRYDMNGLGQVHYKKDISCNSYGLHHS